INCADHFEGVYTVDVISTVDQPVSIDTIIVFDTHWLVNSAYHINCADHFEGVYTVDVISTVDQPVSI
ncbi:hypothetical protein PSY22_23610, partial [Shigella flexneri]|nr:hypothetical protein [Shigella flexneri]